MTKLDDAVIANAVEQLRAARAMLAALVKIIALRDLPHGFPDNDWYEPAFEKARAAIAQAEAAGIR